MSPMGDKRGVPRPRGKPAGHEPECLPWETNAEYPGRAENPQLTSLNVSHGRQTGKTLRGAVDLRGEDPVTLPAGRLSAIARG